MRTINGLLCLMLAAFAAVQYNDPDAHLWMVFYAIAAAWAGIAAYRPRWLSRPPWTILLALCLVVAAVATGFYWPTEEGFWRQEVWWESETAREGMGVTIATIALLATAYTVARAKT